jgi:hypothetical protein
MSVDALVSQYLERVENGDTELYSRCCVLAKQILQTDQLRGVCGPRDVPAFHKMIGSNPRPRDSWVLTTYDCDAILRVERMIVEGLSDILSTVPQSA